MTSTDRVRVRDAVASDAEAIARVHVDAGRETYSNVLAEHRFSEDAFSQRKQYWTGYLSLEPQPGRLVIAERGEALVGFANSGEARGSDAEHGFPPARPLHLFSIYLLAAAHGTGLGQTMLDAVLRDEPAQLWVLRGNHRAIAFYERNGFSADGIAFVDPAEPSLVELRMVR
jgi:ribosomal protein S18 acetylase RimI-like enzyme